ncbi:MAG TPA: hypothetical protein VFN85_07450 [Solirubrobacterales bacterium]|nr:hypothetical protein [Solirubrobacterales bacterium]
MEIENALVRALNRAALDLQQLSTVVRERELEESLVARLGESLPGSVSRQARLNLEGWRGVGNCDVVVVSNDGNAPNLLELKWGAGTLYNCIWDAAKLATALHEGAARRAYLVAGAPASDWQSGQRGAELFGSKLWDVPEFMDHYRREFAYWKGDVNTHPEILPRSFSTKSLCSIDAEIEGHQWQLRCARVVTMNGATVRVDDGHETESTTDARRPTH